MTAITKFQDFRSRDPLRARHVSIGAAPLDRMTGLRDAAKRIRTGAMEALLCLWMVLATGFALLVLFGFLAD
jgi:hypothetical protein